MWIILFCMLCTLHIANRPCHGINFIDLPGFGSDAEKGEDAVVGEGRKQSQESTSGESAFQAEDMLISGEVDGRKKVDEEGPVTAPAKELETTVPLDDILSQMKAELFGLEDQITGSDKDQDIGHQEETSEKYPPVRSSPNAIYRRHWLVSAPASVPTTTPSHNDKDDKLKSKIGTLVQQTVHDTEIKMKIISKLKEKHRNKAAYKVGFILSMIKKSRDVLNELFNVAIKHRDEWKALEQLKIFELIVHTNVDTTNYVRQLVEIHIKNLNSTARAMRMSRKKSYERSGGGDVEKNGLLLL